MDFYLVASSRPFTRGQVSQMLKCDLINLKTSDSVIVQKWTSTFIDLDRILVDNPALIVIL